MSCQPQFILVTGGTGFLGSHVVQQLLEGGYKLRCTARPLKSRFLEAAHLESVRAGQLEVVEVDDLAQVNLERVLAGITAVIHTAFPAPGSMDNTELLLVRGRPEPRSPLYSPSHQTLPRANFSQNTLTHVGVPSPPKNCPQNATSSTTSLLRQAYDHGICKFVLTSSYLAMVGAGDSSGIDNSDREGRRSVWNDYIFSDQDWTYATYESVFTGTNDPAWAYAAAKTLAEAAAWNFASSRPDFDLATVLPTLLLGPFSPGHAILSTSDLSTNVLLHSLLTSGTPPHNVWPHFVDVRDAARAHVKALEAPSLGGYGPASTSTSASSRTSLRKGAGTGQPSYQLRIPGNAHLTSLSQSSNPSLVDLGYTLQDLESRFQTDTGPHSSQFSANLPSPSTSARNPSTSHLSNVTNPPSPTASSSTQSTPTSPTNRTTQTRTPPRKRFIATGTSFTWADAISHLRTTRPDLADSLPDERACLPIPETAAGVEGAWSGAAWATKVGLRVEGDGPVWRGLDIQWRDWRETVDDAVKDLERVARGLERSGWEDLFGGDEDDDEYETHQAQEDDQEKGS